MKVLTLNFLTCAVKACKSTAACFPLHPKDAELVSDDIELNPKLLLNVMARIDWNALKITASELGFNNLKESPPSEEEMLENDMALMKELHTLLIETQVSEGKLVCGNCGHEYAVKEGIANFLLPNHLV